jgi:hypothetical protein
VRYIVNTCVFGGIYFRLTDTGIVLPATAGPIPSKIWTGTYTHVHCTGRVDTTVHCTESLVYPGRAGDGIFV